MKILKTMSNLFRPKNQNGEIKEQKPKIKLCCDCKYVQPNLELWDFRVKNGESPFECARCMHPQFSIISKVDGTVNYSQVFCNTERQYFGNCKEEGKYWEPREETKHENG